MKRKHETDPPPLPARSYTRRTRLRVVTPDEQLVRLWEQERELRIKFGLDDDDGDWPYRARTA